MRRTPILFRGLAALGAASLAGSALAQVPTAEALLARKPAQPNVLVSTPTGAELAGCRVETLKYPAPAAGAAPAGYAVKDAQGRTLRQFIDTTGGTRPNLAHFYYNGVEAYREIEAGAGRPTQYRWLGANGGKWGSDADGDGIVDVWHVLSPEELSQELFAAILTRDPKRLQPLIATEAELKSLGLPEPEIAKARARAAGAMKKLTDASAAMGLTAQARWVHLELGLPHVTPADSFNGPQDLVRHMAAAVLYEKGDGKTADVFQTGELIQVGRAWRLIDGPTAGAAVPVPAAGPGGNTVTVPPGAEKLLVDIQGILVPPNPAEMPAYHLRRAEGLSRIAAMAKGDEQQPWLKQVVDAYASAAEMGPLNNPAMERLRQTAAMIEKDAPKSPAAGYAAFRVMTADYTLRMIHTPAEKAGDVQKWWRDQLEAFLAKYPGADDSSEAMMRLANAYEFAGKEGDAAAKTWYEKLAAAFPNDPRAPRAAGAVRRLGSEGQPLALPPATTLDGKPFSMAQLAGKPVVVYYWANWSREPSAEKRVVDDLKALADLAKAHADKGLTVVTVSLDSEPARAVQALNAAQLPGIHLHAAGGLDGSPLAAAYGIQMVPHLLLAGKDGKVTNRNAQTGPSLKDEVEKLVK